MSAKPRRRAPATVPILTDDEVRRLILALDGVEFSTDHAERLVRWATEARVANTVVDLLLAGGHVAIVPDDPGQDIAFVRRDARRGGR